MHASLLQRYRIGPNFRFVDVNRPRCPVHSSARDGPLNVANQTGEVNYFPSEFANQVCYAARYILGATKDTLPLCAHMTDTCLHATASALSSS